MAVRLRPVASGSGIYPSGKMDFVLAQTSPPATTSREHFRLLGGRAFGVVTVTAKCLGRRRKDRRCPGYRKNGPTTRPGDLPGWSRGVRNRARLVRVCRSFRGRVAPFRVTVRDGQAVVARHRCNPHDAPTVPDPAAGATRGRWSCGTAGDEGFCGAGRCPGELVGAFRLTTGAAARALPELRGRRPETPGQLACAGHRTWPPSIHHEGTINA